MRAFILALLLFLGDVTHAADQTEPPFDFERTLAIVQPTENGYIINQRPASRADYTGNFDRQGFVLLYRTLEPYLYLLQLQEKPQPSQRGAADWQLIFVNPEATQRYLIGDHWFGDGRRWVNMGTEDYNRLATMLTERLHAPANPGSSEGYIERMQKRFSPEEVLPFPEYAGDVPIPETSPGRAEETPVSETFTIRSSGRSPAAGSVKAERVEMPDFDSVASEREATTSPSTKTPPLNRPSEAPERTVVDSAGNRRKNETPNLWPWLLAIAALAFAFIRTGNNS
ncbi:MULTISPECIES: hypothetical protein [unclassified Microbulbifer]|uniref:hypothetical protein n=1 Tax=unclassified Microbulbifer TaxID=2619833 RepID=UPI0027E4448D|nr:MULTISPECIES: hypothetical protein [unclassified Microbulbifer]